jgi:hypothetical protein
MSHLETTKVSQGRTPFIFLWKERIPREKGGMRKMIIPLVSHICSDYLEGFSTGGAQNAALQLQSDVLDQHDSRRHRPKDLRTPLR